MFGRTSAEPLFEGNLNKVLNGGQGQSARADENTEFGRCGMIFSANAERVVKSTDTRIFSKQISRSYVTQGNAIERLAVDS